MTFHSYLPPFLPSFLPSASAPRHLHRRLNPCGQSARGAKTDASAIGSQNLPGDWRSDHVAMWDGACFTARVRERYKKK